MIHLVFLRMNNLIIGDIIQIKDKNFPYEIQFFFTVHKRSCGKVMFYSCLSVHRGGGGWLPSMHHSSHDQGGLHPGGGGWPDPPRSAYGEGDWAHPPRDIWDTMGYGQQAGGTHPTGMLSCTNFFPNRLR